VTVQLYCDTLDQYLYYLDHGASTVSLSSNNKHEVMLITHQVVPKFVNSLVELITSSIDKISSSDIHPSQCAPFSLIEGVCTPSMIQRHFRNTLAHIQCRKNVTAEGVVPEFNLKWDKVDVVSACLKMGIGRSMPAVLSPSHATPFL